MEHPDFAATVFAAKSCFSSIPPSPVCVSFTVPEGGSRSAPWRTHRPPWCAEGPRSGPGAQVAFGWRLGGAEAFPGFGWARV